MNLEARRIAEAHLKKALAARPELIGVLTPDFPCFGKRPTLSDDYYPALCEPHVNLAAAAIIADGDGVKDASGKQHHPDVLVLATGFKAADYLARIKFKV